MPIPPRLVRTVPEYLDAEVEAMWEETLGLHPGWEAVTYRDPIDPDLFPITHGWWRSCTSGAQRAGLIRLEALWHHGGIYVDSDVRMWKSMDDLLHHHAFVIRENEWAIIDAVIGSEPGAPWLTQAMVHASSRLYQGALQSGPQAVADAAMAFQPEVVPLEPVAFCPVEAWRDRDAANLLTAADCPESYGLHLCRNSWGG